MDSNKYPKVSFSIVTVVKNDIEGLKLTEKSIVNQQEVNYEWIVIDGASNDGTKEYLRSCKNPTLRFLSENDSGIYCAMNKGINLAKERYLVFLNAGDIFPKEYTLSTISKFICDSKETVDVLFGGAFLVFAGERLVYRGPRNIKEYLWHGLPANHQATYVRREILKNFTYPQNYKLCGDYFQAAYLGIRNLNYQYLDIPVVKFRIGDTSFSKPMGFIKEAYLIQKNVLKISLILRILSIMKRLVAIASVRVIEHWYRLIN